MSKAYAEANGAQGVGDHPMGTGPYKFDEWVKGTSLTLVRNEDYWADKPDVTRAVYTFIPENSTRVNALLQGEVDLIQRLPVQDVERVEASGAAHVASTPNGLVHTLLLDSSKPPFDDLDVRKAFTLALDVPEIVDALLGDYGRALAVPMAPTVLQYDDSIEPYGYDPDAARQLLEGKAPIALETFTSDGRYVNDRDFYQVFNNALGDVGFEISSQTMEWGRLINMMQNRSAGPFYIIGWDMAEGDASKINSFLHSSSALSVTQDPEYDRLSALAGSEIDEAKRTEIWHQIEKYVHDQYYIAAVWQAASLFGVSDRFDYAASFGDNLILNDLTLPVRMMQAPMRAPSDATPPDVPVLSVRDMDVTVHAPSGSARIVRDVSFDIARGEVFAVIGESGSGKSTAAMAVADLLDPSIEVSGSLRVGGDDLRAMSHARRPLRWGSGSPSSARTHFRGSTPAPRWATRSQKS